MLKNDEKLWNEAAERYMRKKLKRKIEEWQTERKIAGLPWTHEDLAKELHYNHRNTVGNWLSGRTKPPIEDLCKYFNIEPSYFVARNLEELDLMDKDHHEWMENGSRIIAEEYGLSQSFLWFLKSNQAFQDMIIQKLQSTDATLNSFDKDVPDVGSPYQFVCSNGEKAYINEYSIPLLAKIEHETKELIEFMLWKAYRKKKKHDADNMQ